MTSHLSVLAAGAGLVWLLSVASMLPWLATGESAAADCETSCGGIDIPFPFGMGPDHCWLTQDFRIRCEDVEDGVGDHKAAFLEVFDGRDFRIRVVNISLEQGEVQVQNPISSYCYHNNTGVMVPIEWGWDLGDTVYSFSSTANKFTVVGCRAVAYIAESTAKNPHATYLTGCVSMCFEGNMDLNDPCSGMGCCQTAIPRGLKYYNVSFDRSMDTSEIDRDVYGNCSFAVLMMNSYNFNLSTSYEDAYVDGPSNFNNISMGFNSSLDGTAPVVLEWSIGHNSCETAGRNPGYACGSNSLCHDYNASSSGRGGYICKCKEGFEGNPYLPNDDGCQDINECNHPDEYPCFGECHNKIGSYDCFCPRGTQGNASIGRCEKYTFGHGTRIAAGILVGALVSLIALLSTQVFVNKENKKRQRYFAQHGGQMLSRILETEGNNIPFKLYDRGVLVKATHGFHKANIVGEGAHGTVYKAILGAATVAVKRCKQIDESRTSEFVQELVVLCRVNHPNIVRLLGCCLHFEAPMLVYEFVPNGTLSDLLHGRPRRQVTLQTRLRIATETAEALAHLHSPPYPTLHGDVKPQNILLGEGWVAKVSDFGCSTINDNVQVVPKGTLAYLDPQFLKDFQITDKKDVYSFGVVLIELLTGKNPQARKWKNLTMMFQNSMQNGTLDDLLDADIVEEASMGLIYAAAKLVSRCIAVPEHARPAMGLVAGELRRLSDEMPESPEARVRLALEFEDRSYS